MSNQPRPPFQQFHYSAYPTFQSYITDGQQYQQQGYGQFYGLNASGIQGHYPDPSQQQFPNYYLEQNPYQGHHGNISHHYGRRGNRVPRGNRGNNRGQRSYHSSRTYENNRRSLSDSADGYDQMSNKLKNEMDNYLEFSDEKTDQSNVGDKNSGTEKQKFRDRENNHSQDSQKGDKYPSDKGSARGILSSRQGTNYNYEESNESVGTRGAYRPRSMSGKVEYSRRGGRNEQNKERYNDRGRNYAEKRNSQDYVERDEESNEEKRNVSRKIDKENNRSIHKYSQNTERGRVESSSQVNDKHFQKSSNVREKNYSRDNYSERSSDTNSPRENVKKGVKKEGNSKEVEKTEYERGQYRKQNQQPAKGHRRPPMLRTVSGRIDESQRGVLIEQLTMGTYECMVCCETVRGQNAVWNCGNCFHVFHLRCIKQWARSSSAKVEGTDKGWRCPACQNVCDRFPSQYRCFCGKIRDPEWNRMETPHSCGEVCHKSRGENCLHPCTLLCHPGPCPPCSAVIKKTCQCGKTSQTTRCSNMEVIQCDNTCQKQLNCGKHQCVVQCHSGPCSPCKEIIEQKCYGSHQSREVMCGSKESFTKHFCCDEPCNKVLGCRNHRCEKTCHAGDCEVCELMPSVVTHCPCGQSDLTTLGGESRKSCLDSIPTCGKICGKELPCGPSDNHHTCKQYCHEGPCNECEGVTDLKCRCGKLERQFSCVEAAQYKDSPFLCDKRCNKKRNCGRHKCGQVCCINVEHTCDLICGKKLPCGLHKCEEPCHRGNCPPCLMAGFDELTCHCGSEILYPPIPCGAKPPECKKTCMRQHPCEHPVRHNCHSDENCPPCTALVSKWCMGGHEKRTNIPCHLSNISCGLPCSKELPCKQHKCKKTCHAGACLEEQESCQQLCLYQRKDCEHICGSPCHSGQSCPNTMCKAEIKITCLCGNKEAKVQCQVGGTEMSDYQKMTMQNLASSLQSGQSVDIGQLTSKKSGKRKLECDAECAVMERNRRMALALEIKNPDLSGKLGNPSYSEFLKEYVKNNTHMAANIEKAFSELVQNAKKAKQSYRSHSFPSGNRDNRRFIHELAECYGCETQSYDFEPYKNVVATAYKDKCWLPSVTLTQIVQRELHPKAPPPMPHNYSETALRQSAQAAKQSFEVLKDRPIKASNPPSKKGEKVVDYFDFSTD